MTLPVAHLETLAGTGRAKSPGQFQPAIKENVDVFGYNTSSSCQSTRFASDENRRTFEVVQQLRPYALIDHNNCLVAWGMDADTVMNELSIQESAPALM